MNIFNFFAFVLLVVLFGPPIISAMAWVFKIMATALTWVAKIVDWTGFSGILQLF